MFVLKKFNQIFGEDKFRDKPLNIDEFLKVLSLEEYEVFRDRANTVEFFVADIIYEFEHNGSDSGISFLKMFFARLKEAQIEDWLVFKDWFIREYDKLPI